jgi:LmbE family N-acetylglucosaminyl deacetylase
VFAHPDDETFCAGGTLAKYVAGGADAMVVSVTRGQAGQIRDARSATRTTLGVVRERELRDACRVLGVEHVRCMDWADGTLAEVGTEELAAAVGDVLEEFRPDVVITFGYDGAYGHPDHITIGTATTEACRRLRREDEPDNAAGGLRLFHSHFAHNRLLLRDRLAAWVVEFSTRFKGTHDFVRALSVFSRETTTLGYVGDHIEVQWYPAGSYILEQGEAATAMYFVLTGEVEVSEEDQAGNVRVVGRSGAGEFLGETGVVTGEPRNAHVVAVDDVTCLVFSASSPTPFLGRGADARLTEGQPSEDGPGERLQASGAPGATTCIDVHAYVDHKIRAIAAYRSQYPIDPGMFPMSTLEEMFGREYFVRILPPPALEDDLLEVDRSGTVHRSSLTR